VSWLVVERWEDFQHYKDRDPKWIKCYSRLMHDDEYLMLSGHRRAVLHGVWLEYASSSCQLRLDPKSLSSRLHLRVTSSDLKALVDAGWISVSASKPLAPRYQRASLEVEVEEERKPSIATPVDKEREEQLSEALAYMDSIDFHGRPRLEALSLGPTLMDEAIRRTRSRGDVDNPAAYFTTVSRNLLAVQRAWKSDMPLEDRLRMYVQNAGHEYPDDVLRDELERKGADVVLIANLLAYANDYREAA
jgi:hypothetical protein